jgi:hypothetical protein
MSAARLPAQTATEALARAHALTAADACAASGVEDIVVCARDAERDARRYRLPLPEERDPDVGARPPVGEALPAAAETPGKRGCGILAGQRRCSNAERLESGYGGGRDPLTAAIMLGTLLLDPDADVSPPAPTPKQFGHSPE